MSDQVRGILFVVVALLILLVWQHFFKAPVPVTQPKSAPSAQVATPSPASPTPPPSEASAAPRAAPKPAPVPSKPVSASTEQNISIDGPLYHVELSNRGAVVRSWTLKKYLTDQNPPQPLDLVNPDVSKQLGWPFSLKLTDAQQEQDANTALYEVSPSESNFQAPATITFHWSDGHLDVTKKLTFTDNYQAEADVQVLFDGRPIPSIALAWRGGFGDQAVARAATLVSAFYEQNDRLSLLPVKKLGQPDHQDQPATISGPTQFVGIEDQFFTATFLPEGSELSLVDWAKQHSFVRDNQPTSEMIAEIAAGTSAGPLKARVFVGPKDLGVMSQVNPGMESLVNFGWTGIIAKPLLFILQWLHNYIPNYGWVIIILTIVINMGLFPLKMKSWRSMQRMQKVAPEVRSIQDRYKKYSMTDPRKKQMNEEVMAIYQREGINPMGSCLPMLLQMPIWWALWRVLTGAIELRHAPWLFWIHDLSAKDPYYILPILMTITMYLMTKMTPQTTVDPAQQKMTQFMPLMFAVIFFNLSSGLNLYMFTSNLIGVGQQLFLNRSEPLPSRSKFKKKAERTANGKVT
jgi:YidC/Oxa1 family membrane protein insertase